MMRGYEIANREKEKRNLTFKYSIINQFNENPRSIGAVISCKLLPEMGPKQVTCA